MLVEVTAADGEIRARVADWGTWKTPPADPGNSGRGLPLIRAISDAVDVANTADGTRIDMAFSVSTPLD